MPRPKSGDPGLVLKLVDFIDDPANTEYTVEGAPQQERARLIVVR
jgi:hypothetical protein